MLIRGRTCLAAFTACSILLFFAAPSFPSYDAEAGRKYVVACQRLADLKNSRQKKKYRSYWMDCIRTFELVEKQYPKSPSAGDACFYRAEVYLELYQFNKYSKDLNQSNKTFEKCQADYPKHGKAPEALYHIVEISQDYKKDGASAVNAYNRLAAAYPNSVWTARAKTKLGLVKRNRRQEAELRKPPTSEIRSLPKTHGQSSGIVKNIRHWSGEAYTRVVVEQDKPVTFQAHELKDPDRLVFDLEHARMSDSLAKDPLAVNDGILKQVRASQFDPYTVRVVLDLASIKSYTAFPLHDPERLVIDVTGESGGTADQNGAISPPGTQPKTDQNPLEQPTAPKSDPGSANNSKPTLAQQMGLKIKTIAIDAGHGGHDPGAIGKDGLKEKIITLDIAKRLAVLVKDKLGCKVIMTRDRDVYIGLDDRPAIARSRGADLFVSIHVNANRKRKARGIETYIQGLHATDTEAMSTAALENAMSTKKLSELRTEIQRFLKDLEDDSKSEESLNLAHAVQTSLVNNLKPLNRHVLDLKPVPKRAFFYVLINTEMPSILAEVGFISNPDEEKLLRKESYRQRVAEALFQGIKNYVDGLSAQTMGI